MPRPNKMYPDKFFLLPEERERYLTRKRGALVPEKILAHQMKLTPSQLHMKIYSITSFSIDEFGKLCRLIDCTPRDILADRSGAVVLEQAS